MSKVYVLCMYPPIFLFHFEKDSHLTWTDKSPYTFQQWLKNPALSRAKVLGTNLVESWSSNIRASFSQPQPSHLHNCTVLFQLSSDDPMWATVPCTIQLDLGLVICEYDSSNNPIPAFPLIRSTRECSTGESVFSRGFCYKIYKSRLWTQGTFSCGFCPLCEERLATIPVFEAMAPYIGHIIGSQPKAVLLRLNQTTTVLVRSDHHGRLYSDVMLSIIPNSTYTGAYKTSTEHALVCEKDIVTVVAEICIYGQYQCDDGTCILDFYTCDGLLDCPDGSDEVNCTHACSFFGKDWWDGHDCFEKCLSWNCACSVHYFHCPVGKCIPWSFVCNKRDDCGDNSDETHCSSTTLIDVKMDISQNHKWHTEIELSKWDSTPDDGCTGDDGVGVCGRGSGECFPKSALCVFEKSSSNGIRYCSQGDHLLSCQTFDCPTLFKCPESYCIPLFTVCNGHADCPNGEDEAGCHTRQCRGLLLCVKDNICVHPNNILDGEVQCPIYMDDEQSYQRSRCPQPCDCKGYSINCAGMNILSTLPVPNRIVINLNLSNTQLTTHNMDFENYTMLLSLDMSKNEIPDLRTRMFKPMGRIMFLHVDHNLITMLSQGLFEGLKHLRRLNILHNPLISIESGAFSDLKSIETLDLSNLGILTVMPYGLAGLEQCSTLSLSKNNIRILHSNSFKGIDQLRLLDLRENPIEQISRDVFTHLRNLSILVPFGQFCCFISADHCEAPSVNAFTSCKGYIIDKKWSIYIGVAVGMILLLNAPAAALQMYTTKAKFNKLLIILQVTSNTFSCLPLVCFILVDHMLYSGLLFGYSDNRLKKLPACLLTSFLFAICFYTSVALSVTEMFHKYIIIVHPLKTKQLESSKFFPIWSLVFLLITVALSFLVIIHLSAGDLQAINSSCTAFGHGRSDSIAYVTIPVLSYIVLCLTSLTTFTLLILSTLLHEDQTSDIRQLGNTKATILMRNRRVSLKLIPRAVGHSLAPGIFIIFAILDLAGVVASADVSILVTSLIFPITPFLNPILNTILNKDARSRLAQLFNQATCY